MSANTSEIVLFFELASSTPIARIECESEIKSNISSSHPKPPTEIRSLPYYFLVTKEGVKLVDFEPLREKARTRNYRVYGLNSPRSRGVVEVSYYRATIVETEAHLPSGQDAGTWVS